MIFRFECPMRAGSTPVFGGVDPKPPKDWVSEDVVNKCAEPLLFNPTRVTHPVFDAATQRQGQGWICPLCRTVYAPFVPSCNCSTRKPANTVPERTNPIRELLEPL